MSVTRGLTVLQFISVRNIETGEEGALKLNNKVKKENPWIFDTFRFRIWQYAELIHSIEKKRNDYIRLMERKTNGDRRRKTQEQMDKEKGDARWKFSKVILILPSHSVFCILRYERRCAWYMRLSSSSGRSLKRNTESTTQNLTCFFSELYQSLDWWHPTVNLN